MNRLEAYVSEHFNQPRCDRVRFAPMMDEDGVEHMVMVLDDLGIGHHVALKLHGEEDEERGIPQIVIPFDLQLLLKLSTHELGDSLIPKAQEAMERLRNEPG